MSKKIVANYHAVEQAPKQGGVRGMIDRKEWSKLRRQAKRLEAKQEAENPQYRENLEMIRALKSELEHRRPISWYDLAERGSAVLQASETDPIDRLDRRAGRERAKQKGRA